MTKKEMSEIFGILLLAYPNAEVFKGGLQKLDPTISLWCACLPDVEFWIGKQAAIKLCRECKFPPTIAEFLDKANTVKAEVQARIDGEWELLRSGMKIAGLSAEEALARAGNLTKAAVAVMGGADHLMVTAVHEYGDGRKVPYERFNYEGFRAACEQILQLQSDSRQAVGAGSMKQIGGKK